MDAFFLPVFRAAEWVLEISLQASVVIALVLLVQWLFQKRLSPRWRYILWLVVLVRLILPVSPASPFSIFNYTAAVSEAVFRRGTHDVSTPDQTPVMGIPSIPRAEIERATNPADGNSASERGNGASRTASAGHGTPAPNGENSVEQRVGTAHSAAVPEHYIWLTAIWVIGAFFLAARILWFPLRLNAQMAQQETPTGPDVFKVLEESKRLIGVNRVLPVVQSRAVTSPALLGFIRPWLLLPDGLVEKLSARELRFVFLHELAHLKRHDIAVNWLITLVQILHWFNPLVWFVFSRMRADRELACDELALSHSHESDKKPYGETIIRLLDGFTPPPRVASLAGILEDKQQMKRRIEMIGQFKKSSPWPIQAVVLVVTSGLISLTDAVAKKGEENIFKEKTLSLRSSDSSGPVLKKIEFPENSVDGYWPKISPDGENVAYVTSNNLYVSELRHDSILGPDTGLGKEIVENSGIVSACLWSRDGTRLAFCLYDNEEQSNSLRMVTAVGGDLGLIFQDSYILPQDWSHDGEWILADTWSEENKSRLAMIPTEGGKKVHIVANEWSGVSPKLSPDGNFIAFERSNDDGSGVYVLSLQDKAEIRAGHPEQSNSNPHWSPNGDYLLFRSNGSQTHGFSAQRVENGKLNGKPVIIKPDVGLRTGIDQVLNDGRIVYSTWSPGFGIYRVPMDPETGRIVDNPRRIAVGRTGIPSRDGKRVAYDSLDGPSQRDLSPGFRVTAFDGRDDRKIKTDLVSGREIRGWFPDGKSLLLGGKHKVSKKFGVYKIELSTGELESVFPGNGAFVGDQRLSPDGQLIAFTQNGRINVIAPQAGAEPVSVWRDANERANSLSWSPDGARIVFIAKDLKEPMKRLRIVSIKGGDAEEILRIELGQRNSRGVRTGFSTGWSPNGKFIVYSQMFVNEETEEFRNEVWVTPVSGGEPFHLKKLDHFKAQKFHWNPDGTELFFSGYDASVESTDYWTMENYLPEGITPNTK